MPAKKPKTSPEPETLQEALVYFSEPAVCLQFFVQLRWPDGVTCPYCGGTEHSFITTRQTWACKGCRKRFSVKVGTVMEDSPIGLDKWIAAIWMITNAKNGVSSWEVHRAIGVTQKSAWFLLHRIRLAMQQGSFEKMSGSVEADETYIGGKARNMHPDKRAEKIKGTGGAGSGKAIVFGLLDRHSAGKPSRVKTKVIADARKRTLHAEIRAHVEPGSALFTDALLSYQGLDSEYAHQVINHAERYVDGIVHTNGMENFWSLLKRSLHGTYVSVEPFHLFRYLDEQAFRFNEREDDAGDQGRFVRAAAGVTGKRLTYKRLTGKESSDAEDNAITP